MKIKSFNLSLLLVICILGCKNNKTDVSEVEKISMERDSILEASVKKDSSINHFLSSFNEIENNLAKISNRQETLSLHSKSNAELSAAIKNDVNENINTINNLMEQNRQKIISLHSIVKQDNHKIGQLNDAVTVLTERMNTKNLELVTLNIALAEKTKLTTQLNTSMLDLTNQNVNKTNTIQQKNLQLKTDSEVINRAYAAFGIGIIPDQMPRFPGGYPAMEKFIKNNMVYPTKEFNEKISGKVFIELIVEKDGKLSNLYVKHEVPGGFGLTKEAIRLVNAMPKWIPGKEKGQTVRVNLILPIAFNLTEKI